MRWTKYSKHISIYCNAVQYSTCKFSLTTYHSMSPELTLKQFKLNIFGELLLIMRLYYVFFSSLSFKNSPLLQVWQFDYCYCNELLWSFLIFYKLYMDIIHHKSERQLFTSNIYSFSNIPGYPEKEICSIHPYLKLIRDIDRQFNVFY